MIDQDFEWKTGWYVSRLHAVERRRLTEDKSIRKLKALCGAWVFVDRSPIHSQTLQSAFDAGIVPHCKHCENWISKLKKIAARTPPASGQRFTAIVQSYDGVVRRVRLETRPGETVGAALDRLGIGGATIFLFHGWPLLKGEEDTIEESR